MRHLVVGLVATLVGCSSGSRGIDEQRVKTTTDPNLPTTVFPPYDAGGESCADAGSPDEACVDGNCVGGDGGVD